MAIQPFNSPSWGGNFQAYNNAFQQSLSNQQQQASRDIYAISNRQQWQEQTAAANIPFEDQVTRIRRGFPKTAMQAMQWDNLRHLILEKFQTTDVNLKSLDGYSILYISIYFKLNEGSQELLENGADPKTIEPNGQTALHIATAKELSMVAYKCLLRGAPPTLRDKEGKRPFDIAKQQQNVELMQILYIEGEKFSYEDLLNACREGHVEKAKFYESKGVSIHAVDPQGETPLHLAVRSRSVDVVRWLLRKGADKNKPNKHGQTPIHLAMQNTSLDILNLLAPELVRQIPGGQVSVYDACRTGNIHVIHYFLTQGLDINADIGEGYTMLHLACKHNQEELVKWLLQCKPSLESLNKEKSMASNPLTCAMDCRSLSILQMLKQAGANPRAEIPLLGNPLRYAKEHTSHLWRDFEKILTASV